jgi:Cys-tRNA(Pro)/Cys-tRNA(Cys) deacylase
VPTVIEEQALSQPFVFINGGQRRLRVRLDPKLALQVLGAKAAAVVA